MDFFLNIGNKMNYNHSDYYSTTSSGYGVYIDLAILKRFIFSYQYTLQFIDSETMAPYLPDNQYENKISMHSLLIKPIIYHDIDNTFIYSSLGYSWGKINPRINLSDTEYWSKLSDIGHVYSENANSVKIGFGGNFLIYRNITAGFDFEFEKFFNDYASFNLFNPFEPTDTKSQYFTLNLKLGYIFMFHKQKRIL